jgi:hypothetical protein
MWAVSSALRAGSGSAHRARGVDSAATNVETSRVVVVSALSSAAVGDASMVGGRCQHSVSRMWRLCRSAPGLPVGLHLVQGTGGGANRSARAGSCVHTSVCSSVPNSRSNRSCWRMVSIASSSRPDSVVVRPRASSTTRRQLRDPPHVLYGAWIAQFRGARRDNVATPLTPCSTSRSALACSDSSSSSWTARPADPSRRRRRSCAARGRAGR